MEKANREKTKNALRYVVLGIYGVVMMGIGALLYGLVVGEDSLSSLANSVTQQEPSADIIKAEIEREFTVYGRLNTLDILGREKCPQVSGEQAKGISEKWLIRTKFTYTAQYEPNGEKDRVFRFQKRDGVWEIEPNIAVYNCQEWWD